MSPSTLIGTIFGFGLFFASVAMATDNYFSFLSIESFMMVFGGTVAASFMSYQARYVIGALRGLGLMFKKPNDFRTSIHDDFRRLIRWGYIVYSNKGMAALEKDAKEVKDPFIQFSIANVAMGYKADDVRITLETYVEAKYERDSLAPNVLRTMASTSPAFGMIGTLVGLVTMLQSLESDPSQIGSGLAIALLTTLYGVLFARLVFLPAAEKQQQKAEIERFRNLILVEGFALISESRNPRFIQDKLNSFLDPSIHFNMDNNAAEVKPPQQAA